MEDNLNLSEGDKIEVTFNREWEKPGGTLEKEEKVDKGEVCAVPSRTFNWPDDNFDFDYERIRSNGETGATLSVDINNGVVCQLLHESGREREFEPFQLVNIERIE